jgi:transcriptional activator SPT7
MECKENAGSEDTSNTGKMPHYCGFSVDKAEPVPFPPPAPFIPLEADKIEQQIGLLQQFYRDKFAALTAPAEPPTDAAAVPPPSSQPAPGLPSSSSLDLPLSLFTTQPLPIPQSHAPPPAAAPPLANLASAPDSAIVGEPDANPPPPPPTFIPDDSPNPARIKLGPLGQIIVPGASAASKKKGKAKDKDGTAASAPEKKEPAPKGRPKKKKDPPHDAPDAASNHPADSSPVKTETPATAKKKGGGNAPKKKAKGLELPGVSVIVV